MAARDQADERQHVMALPTDKAARYRRASALAVEAETLMAELDELVPEAQVHPATAQGAEVSPGPPEDDVTRRDALDALEDAKTRRDRVRALSDKITQLRVEIETLLEP